MDCGSEADFVSTTLMDQLKLRRNALAKPESKFEWQYRVHRDEFNCFKPLLEQIWNASIVFVECKEVSNATVRNMTH